MAEELLEKWKDGNYLFKYRVWNEQNCQTNLVKKELYLPAPTEFHDDSYDCRILESIPNKEIRFVQTLATGLEQNGIPSPMAWACAEEWYSRQSISSDDYEEEFQKKTWIPFIKEYIGVLSLGKVSDSDFLWTEYGGNSTGYCLVLDKHFFEGVNTPPYFWLQIGGVVYEETPAIELLNWNQESMFKRFFSKRPMYAQEEEFRCVRLVGKKWQPRNISLAWSLRGIILGKNMPQEHEEELRGIMTKHWRGYEIPIIKQP